MNNVTNGFNEDILMETDLAFFTRSKAWLYVKSKPTLHDQIQIWKRRR